LRHEGQRIWLLTFRAGDWPPLLFLCWKDHRGGSGSRGVRTNCRGLSLGEPVLVNHPTGLATCGRGVVFCTEIILIARREDEANTAFDAGKRYVDG
jgi:hypothetical protein